MFEIWEDGELVIVLPTRIFASRCGDASSPSDRERIANRHVDHIAAHNPWISTELELMDQPTDKSRGNPSCYMCHGRGHYTAGSGQKPPCQRCFPKEWNKYWRDYWGYEHWGYQR